MLPLALDLSPCAHVVRGCPVGGWLRHDEAAQPFSPCIVAKRGIRERPRESGQPWLPRRQHYPCGPCEPSRPARRTRPPRPGSAPVAADALQQTGVCCAKLVRRFPHPGHESLRMTRVGTADPGGTAPARTPTGRSRKSMLSGSLALRSTWRTPRARSEISLVCLRVVWETRQPVWSAALPRPAGQAAVLQAT